MKIEITPGFAAPPYTAKDAGGPFGWWYVENKNGFNCVSIYDAGKQTGGKFTNEITAKKLAERWSDGQQQ